jgi:hypothetical protein
MDETDAITLQLYPHARATSDYDTRWKLRYLVKEAYNQAKWRRNHIEELPHLNFKRLQAKVGLKRAQSLCQSWPAEMKTNYNLIKSNPT